jgi:hypothetical protein
MSDYTPKHCISVQFYRPHGEPIAVDVEHDINAYADLIACDPSQLTMCNVSPGLVAIYNPNTSRGKSTFCCRLQHDRGNHTDLYGQVIIASVDDSGKASSMSDITRANLGCFIRQRSQVREHTSSPRQAAFSYDFSYDR